MRNPSKYGARTARRLPIESKAAHVLAGRSRKGRIVSLSGHTSDRNYFPEDLARHSDSMYSMQQLSAYPKASVLGNWRGSDSVTLVASLGGLTNIGRREEYTGPNERRRQSCPLPSNRSWPLAFSLLRPPVLSRKRLSSLIPRRSCQSLHRPSTDLAIMSGAPSRTRQSMSRPQEGLPC